CGLRSPTRSTAHRGNEATMPHHTFAGFSRNGARAGQLAIRLALGLALAPLVLPAPASEQEVGQGSCLGADACIGNTGRPFTTFESTGAARDAAKVCACREGVWIPRVGRDIGERSCQARCAGDARARLG